MNSLRLALLISAALIMMLALQAYAMEPPPPGMIDQMKADGTYEQALQRAYRIGNHKMKAPKRGAQLDTEDAQGTAGRIAEYWGRSLDERGTSALAASSQQELSWISLDMNHDRVVDERDVLALGYPQPKLTAGYPTIGTAKCFVLLIDFPDYPHYFSNSNIDGRMFGEGDSSFWYRSLHKYYENASYNQLNITGEVYGWYTAKHNRTWYHPNDNNSYPDENYKRELLFYEAIDDADAKGADFSQFDNDGDGYVDYFLVIWAGPHGAWASFWWGYQWNMWAISDKVVDGVRFDTYSFQWERYYGFTETPPTPANWDAYVTVHETGHALGLPDYYDYDSGTGPKGGVGGMDQMDGNKGDHNCFSKYCLGWLSPTVAFTNLDDQQMRKTNAYQDAVAFMPGFDPTNPWSEYFMAQVRYREGSDNYANSTGYYPTDGRMCIWHVDARLNASGNFNWDNSYTSHKLLRLMEADGLEEIEAGGAADIDDYYNNGEVFSPTSTPNSNNYAGTSTGITVDDISSPGQTMTADFTLYTSNPPTVTIDSPDDSDTVSGNVDVDISASDDVAVTKVQLLIDDVLVKEWAAGPYEYTWNSLVDFNGSCTITARAWDGGNQVGSDSISVTVSNSGGTSFSDDFESGLGLWRIINYPEDSAGQNTVWGTRTSPASPPPLGSGNEAWIDGASSSTAYYASDAIRSERINATNYTRPMVVRFYYRCRDGLTLYGTEDNGATWDRVEDIPPSSDWVSYVKVLDYAGSNVYLRLYYSGYLKETESSALGANIDNFYAGECPSDPPTVSITSPSDGADITGTLTVNASASDDVSVSKVLFYLNDSLVYTDTASPWQYTRNTLDDDNIPGLGVMAVAVDGDNLPSAPAEIAIDLVNERPYPVADDLENGTSNWSVSNDSKQPQWSLVTAQSHSATHSYGWVGTGWQTNNWDKLTYLGFAPTSGYKTIDLSGSTVNGPVLRFWYKSDITSTSTWYVYFWNTWIGYQMVCAGSGDAASWTEETVDLGTYDGYSGRITIYANTGGTASGGTGLWIDDIRVENRDLEIYSISPVRAEAGDELTINGTNFWLSRGTSYVTFGGNVNPASEDYVSWGNTQIKVNIPLTAKSGDVTVTVGSNTSNGKDLRVVLGPPTIDGGEQY